MHISSKFLLPLFMFFLVIGRLNCMNQGNDPGGPPGEDEDKIKKIPDSKNGKTGSKSKIKKKKTKGKKKNTNNDEKRNQSLNQVVNPNQGGNTGLANFFGNNLGGYGYNITVDAIIDKSLMDWLMDRKRDGSLPNLLKQDEWDYCRIFRECGTYCVLNASLKGPVKAMTSTSENLVGKLLEGLLSYVGGVVKKSWNFLFHNNSSPITESFLRRTRNRIETILNSLKDAAHQSSLDEDVGRGLLRMGQYRSKTASEEEVENDDSEPDVKNIQWRAFSRILQIQILQSVQEIRFHQKYYAENDTIVLVSNNLITFLVGDFDNGDVGGIYSYILNAPSVASLADPDTARSLDLYQQAIDSVISELGILIEARAVEEEKSKGFLSGGSSGSGYFGL